MKALIIILVIAALAAYAGFSVRALWHSFKGFTARIGASADGLSTAVNAPPLSPLRVTWEPPFTRERRAQAHADRRRIRFVREQGRATRLARARARWEGLTSADFPRMNRTVAKHNWDARKAERP